MMKLLPLVTFSLVAAFSTVAAEGLDQILSAEMAAETAGFPAAAAKKEYTPNAKRPQTEVLSYSWDNGRKRKAGVIEVLAIDSVKFGWVRKSSIAMMKDQEADPAFKDIMQVEEGVGDYALWNSRDKQLIVLSGEKSFSLWVNISADDAVNKAKCLELGKKLAGKF